ncbi:MAG: TonB-dependent receptor [Calditrichaeota bacterium]|nr:MAG: TonB-dependent receptor [Calditrichota bacterium]
MKRFILFIIIAALVYLPVQTFGGITGKIRGVVTDAKTGEPLPGANVIVEGTNYGAAASADGSFIILYLPPGTYNVKASMIGYKTAVNQNVKVEADRSTHVDFAMAESVLEGEEVVIVAPVELVKLDVSASETRVTQKDMENVPFANRIEDAISFQSGIQGNLIEGELQIRSGDASEAAILVDGYSMVDPNFNRSIVTISPSSVQEINVIRGGYNAEYGKARSGIVSIVSKTPSHDFHVDLDYQLNPARQRHAGSSRYSDRNFWQYDFMGNAAAMDTVYTTRTEGLNTTEVMWRGWNTYSEELLNNSNPDDDLTPEEAQELWLWRHRPIDYSDETGHNIALTLSDGFSVTPDWKLSMMSTLSWEKLPYAYPQPIDAYQSKTLLYKIISDFGNKHKLTLLGTHNLTNTVTRNYTTSRWDVYDELSYGGGESEMFYIGRKPLNDRRATMMGLKYQFLASDTRIVEADINYFDSQWDVRHSEEAKESDGRIFHGRLYLDPQSGWIPKNIWSEEQQDWVINPLARPDDATGYRMFGGGVSWDDSYGKRLNIKLAMTDQFHRAHELKTGIEFTSNEIVQDRIHWHDDDPAKLYETNFDAKPLEFAAYIQDKVEFSGMVANFGLRYDRYDANGTYWDVHRILEYATNKEAYDAAQADTFFTRKAEPRSYVSPRVGVSFPITEDSKVYFNYGHFVQMTQNEALYPTILDGEKDRVQWMGNPYLDYQKSYNFELGYDQNVFDQFQLHVGAFYKDYSDVESGMVYAHSDQSLVAEWADQREYREVRGLDIELRKKSGRFLTGFFNLNITSKSVSDLNVPGISQIPIITDDPNLGTNGELKGVPRPIIEEIVPYGRGYFVFATPRNWGPKLQNYPVLHRTSASLSIFYTGPQFVEHPDEEWRNQHPNVQFHTLPRISTNLRLGRDFDLKKGASLRFYMDISNLWVSEYRFPPGGEAGKLYYSDLYENGRKDEVGTDKVANKDILRTHREVNYAGEYRSLIIGMRFTK